ncbi:MAG: helix-turn-helix transcriptional regulator [Deltaproteobacteria bacterium]|nr:helix-turn-helix transcriptional regulator [Deltaproteobacteria bacterium]
MAIIDYVRKAKEKAGSQKKLARALGVTPTAISFVLNGSLVPGEDLLMRLADYLGEDPAALFLQVKLEKASVKARPVWKKLLQHLTAATIAGLMVAVLVQLPSPASGSVSPDYVYYVKCLFAAVAFGIPLAFSALFTPRGWGNDTNS